MHYNYFLNCDSAIGRYVESDPIGLDGGINTYGYVGARSTMLVDPYGLEAIPFPNTREGVRVCVAFPEWCAAGAAGVGGYAIGTLAYPYIERPLSKAIDAICRSGPTPEECEKEWAEALRLCRKLIMEQLEQAAGRRKRRSVTGVTGGYTDLQKCAAGLVSEACGGNKVDHGKR
jgi:uncharacterized protein RhaS with RHS repeats